MSGSKESIASAALARLGEGGGISSFDEDTDVAEKVSALYETTILDLFSRYPWRWATVRQSLSIDGAITPTTRWTRAFILPIQRTVMVGQPRGFYRSDAVGSKPMVQGYEVKGRHVYTNELEIICDFTGRIDEELWPGFFEKLAIEALAAELAASITESDTKEAKHRQNAWGTPSENGEGGLYSMAKQADRSGAPTESILDAHDPISAARFGGYSGGWY